jgi:cytochrome b6-f complex iron-sulfur subunit
MSENKKISAERGTSQERREHDRLSRRSFISKLWPILGGVALAEYVFIALDFIRPHPGERGKEDNHIIVAGPLARFEPETVTAFPAGKLYLARLKDGGFLAISCVCTHLGCTVPWDEGAARFLCPCHASTFDITGGVLNPPAPRALDLYPVRIENGIVKIDVSKPIKRRSFDSTQPTYS